MAQSTNGRGIGTRGFMSAPSEREPDAEESFRRDVVWKTPERGAEHLWRTSRALVFKPVGGSVS
jgi:hypothetical protein